MCSHSYTERRAVGREHNLEELQCWSYGCWMRIFPASLPAACLSGSWWSTDRRRWGQRAVSVYSEKCSPTLTASSTDLFALLVNCRGSSKGHVETFRYAKTSLSNDETGSEPVRSWNFVSTDLECRWLASIYSESLLSIQQNGRILLLSQTNKYFSKSVALRFMETWLNDATLDSVLHLPNLKLTRSDRDVESMEKLCDSGFWFYMNERWCTDVTVLKKMCCSDLD